MRRQIVFSVLAAPASSSRSRVTPPAGKAVRAKMQSPRPKMLSALASAAKASAFTTPTMPAAFRRAPPATFASTGSISRRSCGLPNSVVESDLDQSRPVRAGLSLCRAERDRRPEFTPAPASVSARRCFVNADSYGSIGGRSSTAPCRSCRIFCFGVGVSWRSRRISPTARRTAITRRLWSAAGARRRASRYPRSGARSPTSTTSAHRSTSRQASSSRRSRAPAITPVRGGTASTGLTSIPAFWGRSRSRIAGCCGSASSGRSGTCATVTPT